jgi:ribose-phosphate pyrophosphokinase
VIVDDIVDTGGTLTKAASIMIDQGAKSVRAFCTHPVLSGKAYENIENSKLTELIVCDTIPLHHYSEKVRVLSVSHLFADAIQNVYEYGSISSLFKLNDNYQTSLNI